MFKQDKTYRVTAAVVVATPAALQKKKSTVPEER